MFITRIYLRLANDKIVFRILQIALFFIIFALLSSIVSIYFDNKNSNINDKIIVEKEHQRLARRISQSLFNDLLDLEGQKFDNFNFFTISRKYKDVKIGQFNPELNFCVAKVNLIYRHVKSSIIIANFGSQFLTDNLIKKYKFDTQFQLIKSIDDKISNKNKSKVCNDFKINEIDEMYFLTLNFMKTLIILTDNLKRNSSENIQKLYSELDLNFYNSNLAILVSFIFQLIIFFIINFVDIRSSLLSERKQ